MTAPQSDTDAETPVAEADLNAHVERIVRRAGSSFFWAMRRLPEEKRNAMYAIYAFCREVDDIADEPGDLEDKRQALADWRQEIDRLFAGDASHETARALALPVVRFGLCKEDFLAIVAGMELDGEKSVRIKNMAELEHYNDCVACAVGRLSVRVFELPEELGIKLSFAQGQALQLTNILRDIAEDAERDRRYLPEDLLMSNGIDPENLAELIDHPGMAAVCNQIADIAERRYQEARTLASRCDRRAVRPAVMMMEVYHRILCALRDRGWSRISEPVKLSKLEKIWIMFRHGVM